MGNRISRRKKAKPSVRRRPVSRDPSSLHEIEEARKSLEPSIGEELQDCTALYDFPGYHECDMNFQKGDLFTNVRTLRERDDWLLATHAERRERGFIPRDYVCEDSVPDYYNDLKKPDRERLLLESSISEGTYIIRHHRSNRDTWKKNAPKETYTLDVRCNETGDTGSGARMVSYKITHGRDNRVYIVEKKKFDSVTELLNHHREKVDGMRCLLKDCLTPPVHTVAARDLDIKVDTVQLLDKLGSGQYGDVFRGLLKKELPVAVKTLNIQEAGISSNKRLAVEVKKVTEGHRNHRFVQILGVATQQDTMFVVSELMVGGILRDFLREDQGKTIKFTQCLDIAKQICEGMFFLEREERSFRCLLTCGTILVGSNLQMKINPLPLAAEASSDTMSRIHESGYMRWRAPEYIVSETFLPASDVWSYGVLLYEIITFGKLPFSEVEPREFLGLIQNGYKMSKPASPIHYDEEFWYDMMITCLELLPESRPTFETLLDKLKRKMETIQASTDAKEPQSSK